MKQPNNAKPTKLPKSTQLFLLSLLFPNSFHQFQTLAMKKSKPLDAADTTVENISIDQGRPQRYTNGKPVLDMFKVSKDIALPTAPPPENHPELKNLSTEKPNLPGWFFPALKPLEQIASGIAYYARGGYNRHGIGVAKKFVAVMGGGGESWAVYIGSTLASDEEIAHDGEKVVLEQHVKQLIDCEETIQFYRF